MTTLSEEWVGQWRLVARAEATADLMPDGSEGFLKTERWLEGEGPDLLDSTHPASGLALTLNAAGEVTEEASPEAVFEWFDAEGVLESQAVPYSGRLQPHLGKLFLKTDGSEGPTRYGDGDTTIAEFFTLRSAPKPQLIRTVSVETDGIYGNRQVYLYEREA